MCLLVLFILLYCTSPIFSLDNEKIEFCEKVDSCIDSRNKPVCGIRSNITGYQVKVFKDECELLKFGCQVENEEEAYGIVNMEYCLQAIANNTNSTHDKEENYNRCSLYNCGTQIDTKVVCGIRQFGPGYKVRFFLNECEMLKYNCENNLAFESTDIYVCDGMPLPRAPEPLKLILKATDDVLSPNIQNAYRRNEGIESVITTEADLRATPIDLTEPIVENELHSEDDIKTSDSQLSTDTTQYTESTLAQEQTTESNENTSVDEKSIDDTTGTTEQTMIDVLTTKRPGKRQKNLVIVDATLFDVNGNINDTIDNFFASTHVFDLPLRQVPMDKLPKETRRRIVKILQPTKVFQPFITIPENKSTDAWHMPTLASCYHKCPVKCPRTYAPVCGVPGLFAREPSVMFMNHCFMDAAQCKMHWEAKSSTSESSAYIESSFMICLGDTLNTLYRFLPLVRTLQHMGRLKKKGKYHYRMRNMGFFNELMARDPKVNG